MPSRTNACHFRFSSLLGCAALTFIALAPLNASATAIADVSASELLGYVKIYQFSPTPGDNWNTSEYYSVDNDAMVLPLGFSRIGYYLELQAGAGPRQWVWASMDAFTTQLNRIGVPRPSLGYTHQQIVSDMNVQSNVGSIVTGTGIATGNIEFWPHNYSPTNAIAIPNASGAVYDFGDSFNAPVVGHGSMQIHNHDLDGAGAGTAGQTLLAFNAWNGGNNAVGIGNDPSATLGALDWTFATNAYTLHNFEIWVLNDQLLVTPEPSSLALLGLGMVGMAIRTRRRRMTARNLATER